MRGLSVSDHLSISSPPDAPPLSTLPRRPHSSLRGAKSEFHLEMLEPRSTSQESIDEFNCLLRGSSETSIIRGKNPLHPALTPNKNIVRKAVDPPTIVRQNTVTKRKKTKIKRTFTKLLRKESAPHSVNAISSSELFPEHNFRRSTEKDAETGSSSSLWTSEQRTGFRSQFSKEPNRAEVLCSIEENCVFTPFFPLTAAPIKMLQHFNTSPYMKYRDTIDTAEDRQPSKRAQPGCTKNTEDSQLAAKESEFGGIYMGDKDLEAGKENSGMSRNKCDEMPTVMSSAHFQDDATTTTESNSSREMKVFKRVLRDSNLRKPFHTFLEQQFCAENLNFYVAVEQFHDLPHDTSSRAAAENRELCARRIFERHFAPNSMEPVNVDNSTSKRIREMIGAKNYHSNVFDVAQYQIFHLLKYDCWPRFLRAGGIAPEFSDEELADEEGGQNKNEHHANDETCRPDIPKICCPDGESSGKQKHRNWASTAFNVLGGGSSSNTGSHISGKDKRRSLLWHGFDRFSRKLKKEAESRSSGGAGSPVHSTSSRNEDRRRSYSSEIHNDRVEPMEQVQANQLSSAGIRRRQLFSQGKQNSMPAEVKMISTPNSPCPLRQPVQGAPPKTCTLMGDAHTSEEIGLNDPSISVGRWTQIMAEQKGMDKKATEAVDAQTGSTIDPCRQAVDALQNRFVRLVAVTMFAVEILPPNYSFKNPSATPSKIVLIRARLSLSLGAALRPLLTKYSINLSESLITFAGTVEVIRPTVNIGNIGTRTLAIMTQSQFQERQTLKERLSGKDPIASSPLLSAEHMIQFHQHGDISYCELPMDTDKAKMKMCLSDYYNLNLMKFVMRKSPNQTREELKAETKVAQQKTLAAQFRRQSAAQGGPAGVYCGEESQTEHKEPAKKRLSIFKNNKSRESSEEKTSASVDKSPGLGCSHSRTIIVGTTSTKDNNRDSSRTPAIYASKVCADGEAVDESSFLWQPAAYV